jgi:ABC-type lipoprotein release transport system permease subunit
LISGNIVRNELRTQSRRYALVALSMLLGVIGTVAISVANSVAADMLIAQQEQLNGRDATFKAQLRLGDNADAIDRVNQFDRDLRRAAGPAARRVVVDASFPGQFATAAEVRNNVPGKAVTTQWSLGDVNEVQRLPLLTGSRAPQECFPSAVTLNEPAMTALGSKVGDRFQLRLATSGAVRTFVVAGIVSDGLREPRSYGSWATLACAFRDSIASDSVSVRMSSPAPTASAVGALITGAAERASIEVDGTIRRVDTVQSVRDQIGTLSTIFTLCSALLLVASALGIASVGMASVAERARELVVRRAFGARRSDVFLQVVTGALAIGAAVGLISSGLAIAATYLLVPQLIPASSSIVAPAFPWQACVIGVLAALATSLIGSVLPAVKATRVPIARAMRD